MATKSLLGRISFPIIVGFSSHELRTKTPENRRKRQSVFKGEQKESKNLELCSDL